LLLLFSILIDESKQATDCEWKTFEGTYGNTQETKLECSSVEPQPESDWSWTLEDQSSFIPSGVHHLLFNKIWIKSLRSGIFSKFTNVKTIDLSANTLSTIDFNEFANNKKLTKLDVHRNEISKIELIKNSTEINITSLIIHDNDLTNISELCKLKKVEKLDLSRNRKLDYSKVTFSCWSELTHLNLTDTNLKSLNHDYQMLTGCNKLIGLDLSYNDLGMLCFEKFPALPKLDYLNVEFNSLINLDVMEMRRKFQALSSVLIGGNQWSCTYYRRTIEKELAESRIRVILNNIYCLVKSEDPEMRSCPRTEQTGQDTKSSGKPFILFWIFLVAFCFIHH
jgi:Leucine-rich repeat (LRR) protein